MKILYICENSNIDYLKDMLFHGLISLGHEVTDSSYLWYISNDDKSYTKKQYNSLYGNGFTLTKLLSNRKNIDRSKESIISNIESHYYDLIIFSSIWRCHDYMQEIFDNYNLDQIIFIDGEDHNYIFNQFGDIRIHYFKRELYGDYSNKYIIHPISFAIPEEKFYLPEDESKVMINVLSDNISSNKKYKTEIEYYNTYRNSMFGLTHKKNGWDCLRHYEIISQLCLPYFLDFCQKPITIMTNWPINLQIDANYFYNVYNYDIILNKNIDKTKLMTNYLKCLNDFYSYAKNNLTTEELAKYVLKIIS